MASKEEGFMNFEFSTAGRVVFGIGSSEASQVLRIASRELGSKRIFLVTGSARSPGRVSELIQSLLSLGGETDTNAEAEVRVVGRYVTTSGEEPTVQNARDATKAAREAKADLILGIGGGSALDLAKAVACLAVNGSGEPLDHLEVVGRGFPLEKPALPSLPFQPPQELAPR
jgi:alcohol dehydrogenase class IV